MGFYAFGANGTDRYPPFTLADVPDYPARLEIAYPEQQRHGLPLIGWWLLGIPQYCVAGIFAGGAASVGWTAGDQHWAAPGFGGLIGLLVFVAVLVHLFRGEYPRSIFDFVLGLNRWVLRVGAYAALMTPEYPPFRLDAGEHDPGGGTIAPTTPTPPGPATSAAVPAGANWGAGRVIAVVMASLAVLAGLAALAGGGTAIVFDQTQRDRGGYLMTDSTAYSTDTYALVSDSYRTGTSGGPFVARDMLGTVRIRTHSDKPLFVGIGSAAAVDAYLAGVRREVATRFDAAQADFRVHDGVAPATAPIAKTVLGCAFGRHRHPDVVLVAAERRLAHRRHERERLRRRPHRPRARRTLPTSALDRHRCARRGRAAAVARRRRHLRGGPQERVKGLTMVTLTFNGTTERRRWGGPARRARAAAGQQEFRLDAGARRLLVLGRARPDARLPRTKRRRQDDRRCGRSSASSSSTPASCSGTAARSASGSGCGSATCPKSAACIRGCRSASSSSISVDCTACTPMRHARLPRRWLERLGLADRAGAKVEELSHGNQQRVQLAAALLHEPELLVLDEPFAGLDPVAVQTLAEVLRGEAARGTAVLFSSHQLELVEDICEEVAIIDHGRIVATGDMDALRRRSQRRRIELELDGAPPAWLPDIAGVELVERRNGDLRLFAGRDVDPRAGARGGASRRRASSRSATGRRRSPSSSWSWWDDERAARDRLVAWREIRERLRSRAFLARPC